MKITLSELIGYIRDEIPRLRLYDTFIVLCLIDDELVGRRGFSLTGLEWYLEDGQLYWKDEEKYIDRENMEVTREAQEVIDSTIEAVKNIDDKKLRDWMKQVL